MVYRDVELRGGTLDVWSMHQYVGGLFIRSRTDCGSEATAPALLLDTAKGSWLGGDESSIVLDLNFAYHPSCRYDDRWRCPLAAPGNTVDVRVEAGERPPGSAAQPRCGRCMYGVGEP